MLHCPKLTFKIKSILVECDGTNECCNSRSEEVLALAENSDPVFKKSIYWKRCAVGLKVPTKLLLEKDQKKCAKGFDI